MKGELQTHLAVFVSHVPRNPPQVTLFESFGHCALHVERTQSPKQLQFVPDVTPLTQVSLQNAPDLPGTQASQRVPVQFPSQLQVEFPGTHVP